MGTLVTALLVTLARPSTWLLALAAFLVRGGIVLLVLPIIILPTPVGIANLVGPTLIGFVFGGISSGFVALAVALILGLLVWILAGAAVAGAVETELAAVVAADEEVAGTGPSPARPRPGAAGRAMAARLFALAPLLVALVWGAAILVGVAYAELTLPTDTDRPILWRIVTTVPETVLIIGLAWALSEVLAARATRRIALDDASVIRALGGAFVDAVRHPLTSVVGFVVPLVVLVLVLVPTAAATGAAWDGLRTALQRGHTPIEIAVSLVGFVGLWLAGAILAAMVCAWRQAIWTVDLARRRRGTFGVSTASRPGGWNTDVPSVTL